MAKFKVDPKTGKVKGNIERRSPAGKPVRGLLDDQDKESKKESKTKD